MMHSATLKTVIMCDPTVQTIGTRAMAKESNQMYGTV